MSGIVIAATSFVVGIPLLMAITAWLSEPRRGAREAKPVRLQSGSSAAAIALAFWAVLTAAGEVIAVTVNFYPVVLTDKGEEIEKAFRVLTIMSVPVFTMVLAVLVYGLFRRGFRDLPSDGPPIQGRGTVPFAWFGITAALTLLVMIYPGLTSLHKVLDNPRNPDLVVKVEGMQWTWLVSYPEQGVANVRELRLPVGRTVRFEITSRDVLHSFWVPAFLMKIDAVPGITTTISLKPTRLGSVDMDPTIRLQCAELCGLSHSNMRIPVSVVSAQDFDSWVKEKKASASVDGSRGASPSP